MGKYFIPIALLLCVMQVRAQIKISGIVLDREKKNKLPFVNIGIKSKNIGTISSEDGEFSISIPQQYTNDTLTFSIIGFEELTMEIAGIDDGQHEFLLKQSPTRIDEVVITGKKPKEKKYGIMHNPLLYFMDASIVQDDIFEIAQVIQLSKNKSKITSLNLCIREDRRDSGIFRINFYKYEDNKPGKKLLDKNIVQVHAIRLGWLRFDLSAYDIYLQGTVVAAIEFIPNRKKSRPISYAIKPGGRAKSFVRTNSLGSWERPPSQYRMFVTALNTDKEQDEAIEKEISPAFRFYSENVSDSFCIFLRLPKGYKENTEQSYPITYILDANLYFSLLSDSLDNMRGAQPILAGIGYRNFLEMDSLRNRDYTYPEALASDSFKISGGGDKFYSFIKDELVPYMDLHYRTDKQSRTLMGHSLGGYFTLYALYKALQNNEQTFSRYVTPSPSVEYRNQYLTEQLKTLNKTDSTKRSLYISWRENEDADEPTAGDYHRHATLFTRELVKKARGLDMERSVSPNMSHMTTALPAFYEGMQIQK